MVAADKRRGGRYDALDRARTSSEARIGSIRRSISASEWPTSKNAYIAAPATNAENALMPTKANQEPCPHPAATLPVCSTMYNVLQLRLMAQLMPGEHLRTI